MNKKDILIVTVIILLNGIAAGAISFFTVAVPVIGRLNTNQEEVRRLLERPTILPAPTLTEVPTATPTATIAPYYQKSITPRIK